MDDALAQFVEAIAEPGARYRRDRYSHGRKTTITEVMGVSRECW
jgi:hypothetical protein